MDERRFVFRAHSLAVALALAVIGGNISLAANGNALGGDGFIIVERGEARARIVIAEREASGPILFAAEELERYLKLMSGVSVPIVKSPGPLAAAPGTLVITADPDAAGALGLPRPSATSEDRYHLRAADGKCLIAGATQRAALFGAYDLLERLGCGWCVPGDESVPKRANLSIPPLAMETAPAFPYRMMLDFELRSTAQSIAIVDWLAKNRMNWVHPCPNAKGEPRAWYERRERLVPELKKRGIQVIFGGHTMHTWLPPDHFADHPDWFAYNDGARQPPTLCVTNSDMTAELIKNLDRFLERCPEVEVVDLWHPDGEVFCHCPLCTQGLVPAEAKGKIPSGTPPDAVTSAYVTSYLTFMNRVAAAIGKSHSRVLISPLIYGPVDHSRPDGCPEPAENLLVGLAHISRDSYRPLAGEPASARNQRFLGNDLTWMAVSKHHYIYEYYNGWVPPFVYPGARVIVRDLQILRELGSQGASSDMYGYSPCNMYVAARALWSPEISWEAAVRDFHARYFGDAGGELAEDWIELEKKLYGKAGYQAGGSLSEPSKRSPSGQVLNEARPREIELLEKWIARTEDPQTKARLERALRPWKLWSKEARYWAFPPFEGN